MSDTVPAQVSDTFKRWQSGIAAFDLDKIAKERTVLEDKEKRSTDLKGLSPADKKDIDAKCTELDNREKTAQAKRDKLWELRPRNEAKGEAKPA